MNRLPSNITLFGIKSLYIVLFVLSIYITFGFSVSNEANAISCSRTTYTTRNNILGAAGTQAAACTNARNNANSQYACQTSSCTNENLGCVTLMSNGIPTLVCTCQVDCTRCNPSTTNWTCPATQCTNRSSSPTDSTCTYFGGTVTCNATPNYCDYTITVDRDARCGSSCPAGCQSSAECSGSNVCVGTSCVTPTPLPKYRVSGNVFSDTNNNGARDSGEGGAAGITVTLTRPGVGSATDTTDSAGNYDFGLRDQGNLTAAITVPSGRIATTTNPVSIALNTNRVVNFGLGYTYTVSGNVYIDANRNGAKDSGEANAAGRTLTFSGGTTGTTNSSGNYSFSGITAGTRTLALTVPSGYSATTTNPASVVTGPNRVINYGYGPNATSTPTPTPCAAPSAPSSINPSGGSILSGTRTITWSSVSGAASYQLRIDDQTNAYSGVCSSMNAGDVCNNNVSGTSYSFNFQSGRTYRIWVHATSSCGATSGSTTSGTITVVTPTPTPAPTYTISGNVYVDANRNGSRDPGEGNATGRTVTLSGTGGGTRTTDGSGNYSFTGLTAGSRNVTLTVPSGNSATTTNPRNGVAVGPNQTVNFGYAPVATPTFTPTPVPSTFTISGSVYVDTNRNGSRDSGESVYVGATLNISTGGSTTTNSSGNYTFNNVTAGSRSITLTLPSGYSATTTNPRSVTVGPNQSNIAFGMAQTFSITGNVYIDANRNGAKDSGEANANGRTITLSGAGGGTTTTNSSGNYTFSNLAPGTRNVTLTVPSGNSATTTNPRNNIVVGPDQTVNFGYAPTVTPTNTPAVTSTNTPTPTATPAPGPVFTISGNVYIDTNRNGSKDSGEANASGRTVTLSGSGGGNDTTDSSGNYSFANLVAGTRNVTLTVPAGNSATTTNPRSATVGPNQTVNFGYAPDPTSTNTPTITSTPTPTPSTYTISGAVYIDANGNGARDAGENGYQGAQVGLSTGQTTSTNSSGNYTFSGLSPATRNVTLTVPSGYSGTTTNPRNNITVGPNQTVNFGMQPDAPECDPSGLIASPTTINMGQTSDLTIAGCAGSGGVTYEWNDPGQGSVVDVNSSATTYTAPSTINSTIIDNPTVTVCSVNGGSCQPFGTTVTVRPTYSVSGLVFNDDNKNDLKDGSEQNYTASSITISSTGGGSVTYPSAGTFLVSNLLAGSYTISYTNLPSGYNMTYPQNGPPPSFSVTVGGGCSVGGSNSAGCSARGDISNIHFGITNSIPWIQTVGTDIRSDGGFNNPIPSTAACGAFASLPGAGGMPGIVYTGAGSSNFGQGQASPNPFNWVQGGLTYPDNYSPTRPGVLRNSYQYVLSIAQQNGITPTDLAPFCSGGIANCDLQSGLLNGLYRSNGNLTLVSGGGSYSFDSNRNYVILVNGDLRIRTEIHVPVGSSVYFFVSGNIYIEDSVGTTALNCSSTADLEGSYAANGSVIVEGNNGDCTGGPDERLTIGGGIMANAGLTGGSFQNQRDLCENNLQYASIRIVERIDFMLNAPNFLRKSKYTFQEIAP